MKSFFFFLFEFNHAYGCENIFNIWKHQVLKNTYIVKTTKIFVAKVKYINMCRESQNSGVDIKKIILMDR